MYGVPQTTGRLEFAYQVIFRHKNRFGREEGRREEQVDLSRHVGTNGGPSAGSCSPTDNWFLFPSNCPISQQFDLGWVVLTLCSSAGAIAICGCICCFYCWRRRRNYYTTIPPINHSISPLSSSDPEQQGRFVQPNVPLNSSIHPSFPQQPEYVLLYPLHLSKIIF